MTTTPETTDRDYIKDPLTELEKAYLSIAAFDMALYDLRATVQSLLMSRRKLTGAQSAVLTERLDDLWTEAQKPAPKWPTK